VQKLDKTALDPFRHALAVFMGMEARLFLVRKFFVVTAGFFLTRVALPSYTCTLNYTGCNNKYMHLTVGDGADCPSPQNDTICECVFATGKYCIKSGVQCTSYIDCEAGYKCDGEDNEPCETSEYQDQIGQSSCKDCVARPNGVGWEATWTNSSALTEDRCPWTYTCEVGQRWTGTACEDCGVGTYQNVAIVATGAGAIGTAQNCTNCSNKPAAADYTTSSKLTTNTCPWSLTCSAGTYFRYNATETNRGCETCPAGYVCASSTTVDQTTTVDMGKSNCGAGNYCPNLGMKSALPCPLDKICSGVNMTSYDDCPDGSTSTQGTSKKSECYFGSSVVFTDGNCAGTNCSRSLTLKQIFNQSEEKCHYNPNDANL
jgi:hypothetical protein